MLRRIIRQLGKNPLCGQWYLSESKKLRYMLGFS